MNELKQEKKAFQRPEVGPLYLVPDPKSNKYFVYASFDTPGNEEVHLFLWAKVIELLRRRFKKAPVDSLENSYRGLPRARVMESGDRLWVVAHGSDFPLEKYKDEIISEFGLRDAVNINKVRWEHDPHETMDKAEKADVEAVLKIKMTPSGFTVGR